MQRGSPVEVPNAKKSSTAKQWSSGQLMVFQKTVSQLGGVDEATPEAILNLMNANDSDGLPLTTNDIAHQIFCWRQYFKRIEMGCSRKSPSFWSRCPEDVDKQWKTWSERRHKKFVDTVLTLGGVDKASVHAVQEAMNVDTGKNNEHEGVSLIEVANRLHKLRPLFKKFEEGGLGFPSRAILNLLNPAVDTMEGRSTYGKVRRRASSVRSTPYTRVPVSDKAPSNQFLWTLDTHRRFVDVVAQLGGVEKATPKAILELMKAEGLTVAKVAGHLQGLKQLLGGEEKLPILRAKKDDGSGYAAAPASSRASDSSSFNNMLNNFSGLSFGT